MEATFLREGKEMTYIEVIESLENMIRKGIIDGLDRKEIENLYVRLFETSAKSLKDYLNYKNYTVKTAKQGVQTAIELKLIPNQSSLKKALEIYESIKKDEERKRSEIKEFLCEEYYPIMKQLEQKIKLYKE